MAESKILPLARKFEFAKKLHPEVTLLKYESEIKPFLNDLESALSKTGVLQAQSKVKIRIDGINAQQLTVPSKLIVDDVGLASINEHINELLLPSDLVRILTKLAIIFKKGDGKRIYNPENILDNYVRNEDDLYWVKEWGQTQVHTDLKKRGIIVETKFSEPNASKVKDLYDAVVKASQDYEKQNTKLDTTDFDLQTQAEDKYIEDLLPRILEKFDDYQNRVEPNINSETKFSEADRQIKEKITELIKNDRTNFFLPLYSGDNLNIFEKEGVFDRDRNAYLVTTRASDSHDGILQFVTIDKPQYKDFYEEAVDKFLKDHGDDISEEFIDPLFVEEKKEEAEKEVSTEAGEDSDSEGGSDLIEKIEFTNPVNEDTFRKKLLEDVTTQLIKKFEDEFCPTYSYEFRNNKDKLTSSYLNEVTKEVLDIVQKEVIEKLEIEDEDLKTLVEKNLYSDEKYNPEILESDWYKELITQSVEFIGNFPSPDLAFENYFTYLFENHIRPLLEALTPREEPPEQEEAEEPPTDEEPDFTSGIVPPVIPITPSPDQPVTVQTDQINTLTPEQVRTLQYESAWMYNRAIYELFTSKGIKVEDVDPTVLRDLQANVFNYVAGMDQGNFNKLFGSASYRQQALLDFYNKSGYGINKFVEANELLQIALKSDFNIDSPVLTENIKNTVDSLIVQYGLNQDFYAFDPNTQQVTQFSGQNAHDIIWFIDNVPADRLALIFNIPPGILGTNEDIINKLRETLKAYAQVRGSELSLHIQNTTLQKGLVLISDEDAQKIKDGDPDTIAKHLSFTNDIRDMSKAHGGKTVVGAIDDKQGGNHKKEIQKQYKTFLPLWSQLSGVEQAEVYRSFGIPIPGSYLSNGKLDKSKLEVAQLEFIPEFIFFDVNKLGNIKKILKLEALDEQKRQELLEIMSIQDQLRREQELAAVLNEEYDRYSDPSELQEIGTYVGVDTTQMSFREKFVADEEIQAGGSDEYETTEVGKGRGGLVPRFLDSKYGKKLKDRFGKRFKKKVSAKEKGKKAFKKAASAAVTKVAAATLNVIPGVGTALSAALLAIKNKKLREFLGGLIVGGLTLLIGRTLWALGSIGGAIGGVIGGAVGFVVSGGGMVIPGVIIGANIGELIIPARWTSWGFVQDWLNQPPTYIKDVTGISTVSPVGSSSLNNLSTMISSYEGIGVLAVGGFALSSVFLTIFIIFTMYSAFLIPVPVERPTTAIDPIGGIGIDSCDDPTPLSDKITKNSTSEIAGRAYDIVSKLMPGFWCYWNWNPDYDGLNETFTAKSPESPDLFNEDEFDRYPYHCVYRDNFPDGCDGDYRAMDGNALYWCTWLVNHSYQNNYSLAARIMAEQFQTLPGHIFLPVSTVTYQDIQPGDVIFTSTAGRNGNIGHVAIIHDVGPDFIRSIDSNASSRYHSFTVNSDGSIQTDSIPYLDVVGFGRRL